jgi:hypothetical protein
MKSVKKNKGTGKFVSLQKVANPVPANVLTQSFLRYAYGVSKETLRRWLGEGAEFPHRVPHNKGRNMIEDFEMASKYYSPKDLFNTLNDNNEQPFRSLDKVRKNIQFCEFILFCSLLNFCFVVIAIM